MKRADLRLDTVYADPDGTPIAVIRADPVILTSGGWHSSPSIRAEDQHGKGASRGLIVRATYMHRAGDLAVTVDDLPAETRRLRDEPLEKERHGRIEVRAVPLTAVVKDWDDHLIAERMQRDAQKEKRRLIAAGRAARAADIAELRALLPDRFKLSAHDDRDHIHVPLADLLALLRLRELNARRVAG